MILHQFETASKYLLRSCSKSFSRCSQDGAKLVLKQWGVYGKITLHQRYLQTSVGTSALFIVLHLCKLGPPIVYGYVECNLRLGTYKI